MNLEDHEFYPGKIYSKEIPEGLELDNVCSHWKTHDLQCLKSLAAHRGELKKESLHKPESQI